MADCRFSSMAWKCELYVYESPDGVQIHVSDGRLKDGILPHPDHGGYPMDGADQEKSDWLRKGRENMEALDALDVENCYDPIVTPSAGKSFTGLSLPQAAIILLELKEEGIIFPDYVLEDYLDLIGNPKLGNGDSRVRGVYEENQLGSVRSVLECLAEREDMLSGYGQEDKEERAERAAHNKALLRTAAEAVNACADGWRYAPGQRRENE